MEKFKLKYKNLEGARKAKWCHLMVGGRCGSCPLLSSLFKKPNVESPHFSNSGVAPMKQTLLQRAVVSSG